MSVLLVIAIVSGGIYLILDAVQKYAAMQELARVAFFAAMLALLLTLK